MVLSRPDRPKCKLCLLNVMVLGAFDPSSLCIVKVALKEAV